MSGNDPGVESLGAWDTEHLATCGTFQHNKELPRSKCQQHPTGDHLSTVLCSCAAAAEEQQAKWHFPALKPDTAKKIGIM